MKGDITRRQFLLSTAGVGIMTLLPAGLARAAGITDIGDAINKVGRQRMLSQRMAKFYMFRVWGIKSPWMEQEAQLARREFVSALDALGKARENDNTIKKELELARTQWLFFDEALKQQDVGGKDTMIYATNVATTSERLLEVMDRVTGHYARISAASAPVARKR